MDDKSFADALVASVGGAARELGRRAGLISADYLRMAEETMHEGGAQFEEVFMDLSRGYQKLSDLLYTKASKL